MAMWYQSDFIACVMTKRELRIAEGVLYVNNLVAFLINFPASKMLKSFQAFRAYPFLHTHSRQGRNHPRRRYCYRAYFIIPVRHPEADNPRYQLLVNALLRLSVRLVEVCNISPSPWRAVALEIFIKKSVVFAQFPYCLVLEKRRISEFCAVCLVVISQELRGLSLCYIRDKLAVFKSRVSWRGLY